MSDKTTAFYRKLKGQMDYEEVGHDLMAVLRNEEQPKEQPPELQKYLSMTPAERNEARERMTKELNERKEKMKETKTRLEALQQRSIEVQQSHGELISSLNEMTDLRLMKGTEQMRAALVQMQQEISDLKRALDEKTTQMEQKNRDLEQQARDLDKLQGEKTNLLDRLGSRGDSAELAELHSKFDALSSKLEAKNASEAFAIERADLKTQIRELTREREKARGQNNTLNSEVQNSTSEINKLKEKLQSADKAHGNLSGQITILTSKLTEAEKQSDSKSNKLSTAERKLATLQETHTDCVLTLEAKVHDIQMARDAHKDCASTLESANGALVKAQKELDRLADIRRGMTDVECQTEEISEPKIVLRNEPHPADEMEEDNGRTWFPTGFEFLKNGSTKAGERIIDVSNTLLKAVDEQIEVFKGIALERARGKNRQPEAWPIAHRSHRCIRSRGEKDGQGAGKVAPMTACAGCVEKGVPCFIAYPDQTPVVLPLPEEYRSGGPTDMAYYVKQ